MLRFETFRAQYSNDDDALAAAIWEAKYGGKSCVIEWLGQITLNRQPPNLDRVWLKGDDIYGATIHKNYPGGVLLSYVGGRPGFSGGGLSNFSVTGTPAAMANSYLILARADAQYYPHGLQLKDLYLGGGAYRAIEIIGYGSLGIRQPRIENVTCFGTQASPTVYLYNTVDCKVETLRVYPAGGVYGTVLADPAVNPGLSIEL